VPDQRLYRVWAAKPGEALSPASKAAHHLDPADSGRVGVVRREPRKDRSGGHAAQPSRAGLARGRRQLAGPLVRGYHRRQLPLAILGSGTENGWRALLNDPLTGSYATDLRLYVARKVPGRRRPSAARMRNSPIAHGDRGQRVGQLKVGGAVLQTAVMLVVTRHDSSGLLNCTAHSPEDSQRYRKCLSARLQRTVPKGSFQYRRFLRKHNSSRPRAWKCLREAGWPAGRPLNVAARR
jgi:hypothetical protein